MAVSMITLSLLKAKGVCLADKSNLYSKKDSCFETEYHMSRQLYERFGFVLNPEKDFNHNNLDIDQNFKSIMSHPHEEFLEAALESEVFTKSGKYKLLVNINSY